MVSAIAQRFYPTLQNRWDDIAFRDEILGVLRPEHVILDLGCGRGAVPQMDFRGFAAHVHGVDSSRDSFHNPFLDEARIGTAEALPYPDSTFDAVICNNVLEHLADPAAAFREVKRVLKPRGRFFAKTPNRWHYVTLASRFTPYAFHRWFHQRMGNDPEDIFPTHYRANSLRRLRHLANKSGLVTVSLQSIEGRPEYLRWAAPAYMLGVVYERLVNSSEIFSGLRCILIGHFIKPNSQYRKP